MGRAPFCDKNELKKGPWTQEEDQKLIDYIQIHGHGSWRTLPKKAGLERHGKSCRLRWTNYLRPDIKRGRFSFEEEEAIIQLHSILGNKWSAIAARLPGRTDNEIKNYWNTHIRKRLLQMGIDPVTHSPRLDLLDLSSILSSSIYNSSQLNVSRMLGIRPLVDPEILRLASTFFSSQPENRDLFLQNPPENQLCNPQVQNHLTSFQSNQLQTPVQEIQACTTSITPCAPVLNESQFMRTNVEQFPPISPNFSYQISEPNVWLDNLIMTSNFTENLVPMQIPDNYSSDKPIIDPLSENSNIHSNTTNYNQFSFPLAQSTSSSSPTPLNSSLTYVNSNIEDERDSYCSNILKFEIPDILEVNDFM